MTINSSMKIILRVHFILLGKEQGRGRRAAMISIGIYVKCNQVLHIEKIKTRINTQ